MNSRENVKNALQVLFKTYDNVEKLMDYCKIVAAEKTNYVASVNKFLRRKSDNDTVAWLLNDFILLFQNRNHGECESENGWRNGPIYVLEICLGEKGSENLPLIYLSKFEYHDLNSWNEGCSPANHWAFYFPLRYDHYMDFTIEREYKIATPKNEKSSKTYWGLKKITTKSIDLFEVTSENLEEKIFGEFDKLADL